MTAPAAIFEWTLPIIFLPRRQEKQALRDESTVRVDGPKEEIG